MTTARKIRTLIVDDSATARSTLTMLLETDPEIEVAGAARDPYDAVEHIARQIPDVILLDLEMPHMDGLTFLERIMQQHPIPVVICSATTGSSPDRALDALAKGAVDVVAKPRVNTPAALEQSAAMICEAVRAASRVRLTKRLRPAVSHRPKPSAAPGSLAPSLRARARPSVASPARPSLSPDVMIPKPSPNRSASATEPVIVVGASTGGTEALLSLLQGMTPDCPGIVIVQHMLAGFTARFAERLNSLCPISVKEAETGDRVTAGSALVAPGNLHMLLMRNGSRYRVELRDGPLVSRHRPSVNILFRSAARCASSSLIGVIMTGMGDDGALGLLEMKAAGAWTIAQDEASCIVFGMPQEAIKAGAVDDILPLDHIAPAILKALKRH